MEDDVEISCLAAKRSGFAEAGEANARAIFDAGRDFGFYCALAKHSALPSALQARIGDDLPQALARGTGPGDAEEALLMADLAVTVAGAAGNGRFSWSSAGAVAGFAGFVAADGDGFFGAEDGFFEFQFQIFAKVRAALDSSAPLASSAAAAENVEAEEIAENVVEIVEDGLVEAAATVGADSGVAEAVVGGALVAVGQHGVGLGGFLETFLRGGVSGIAVGVVLHGELAVGALDLLLACASFYS